MNPDCYAENPNSCRKDWIQPLEYVYDEIDYLVVESPPQTRSDKSLNRLFETLDALEESQVEKLRSQSFGERGAI